MTDPATISYGLDLSCISDIDPGFRTVSGRRLLAEAIARRLITPRGQLLDDPNYGYDLTGLLKADISTQDLARISSLVEAECEKDERVVSATATVTLQVPTAPSSGLFVSVLLQDGSGPFPLVLAVSAVTVQLLQPQG